MSSQEQEQQQDPYGAIKFGEFRKYMQNKQNKLKRQQKELGNQASQELIQIFQGLSIYINGYTNPAASDLRRMILQHGGDYQHYLKKISVTHIIATNLTNAKIQEFGSYKVVKPNWITESIETKQLLPWQNYRLVPRSTRQKELTFQQTGESLNATMLANDWARSVSTVNPEFIKRFYQNSRLHYLSTWKGESKEIVEKLEQKYPKKNIKKSSKRVVMHIDFDCFFASVGIKDRPHLKNKPVAVSHSKGVSETSSSDIASCNYVARSFGLKNGMTIGTAKTLCPDLQVVPYEFEKYRSISEMFYEILFQYADEMQAVSVDEALLEVGSHVIEPNTGQEELLATKIRNEIRTATGCEASIGIGPNILLARMATKKAKPAGQYHCQNKQDIELLLSNTSVIDLPGVGYSIQEKLSDMNITTVSDVKKIALHQLQTNLGAKMGQTLNNFSCGIDDRSLTTNQQRQSVSAEVNWGVRFENEENEKAFLEGLSREVSDKLIKHELKGKTVTIKILKRKPDAEEASKNLGHGKVDAFSKSYTTHEYTDNPAIIYKHAYTMLKSFRFSCADIRGLGIQLTRLDNQSVSPDQGKVLFKPQISTTTAEESHHNLQPTTFTAAESSTKIQRSKEEMTVDYNMFKELPESVQQELMSNYELKFQNQEQPPPRIDEEVDDEEEKSSFSLPELPPWSQLDPDSLLALPEKMRAEVLRTYGNNDKNLVAPVAKKQKISAASSPKRTRTITELFQIKQQPSTSIPYDVNVWNELPFDVRTELLTDINKQKRLTVTAPAAAAPLTQPQKLLIISEEEPSLQGLSDMNDIRSLLREWVTSCHNQDQPPELEDIDTLFNFLVSLVKSSNLEKTRLVIIYLLYLTKNHHDLVWHQHLVAIQDKITDLIVSIYGYPLNF